MCASRIYLDNKSVQDYVSSGEQIHLAILGSSAADRISGLLRLLFIKNYAAPCSTGQITAAKRGMAGFLSEHVSDSIVKISVYYPATGERQKSPPLVSATYIMRHQGESHQSKKQLFRSKAATQSTTRGDNCSGEMRRREDRGSF